MIVRRSFKVGIGCMLNSARSDVVMEGSAITSGFVASGFRYSLKTSPELDGRGYLGDVCQARLIGDEQLCRSLLLDLTNPLHLLYSGDGTRHIAGASARTC